MKKFVMPIIVSVLLTACQTQEPDKCPLTPLSDKALKQEALCKHFAGEDPYDAERAAFIKKRMEELNCGLFF